MPSIGGLRTPVNDLTRLTDGGAEVLEKQAAVLRSLSGDSAIEVPHTVRLYSLSRETAKLTYQGMSASDEAFYGAITRLSKRMTSSEQPLSGLFDGTFCKLIKLIERPPKSIRILTLVNLAPWRTHHRSQSPLSAVRKCWQAQLATILDLKSREIGQANKSKSKEQKALMQELKEVRDNLKSQLKPLIGKFNGLIMDDREIDWRGTNRDLIDVSSQGHMDDELIIGWFCLDYRTEGHEV
jgi:hypothetical protein